MRISKAMILSLALAAVAVLAGCSTSGIEKTGFARGPGAERQSLAASARTSAEAAMKVEDKGRAAEIAEEGIGLAEQCLEKSPEDAGCHYWRAVNTGLYVRSHVIGYQRLVKRMIDDCERVNSIDPSYEHAGAWRMMGQIYTALPETAGRPDSVVRDLALAEDDLRKAVQIAPDYPENHLALAEALFAQGKSKDARDAMLKANELAHNYKSDISYGEWKRTSLALEKKISKTAD